MNKIYKVIWSKVKHQYVVVSELAHSNGKQSRTSRNSIRSRIAALVVCGAIAAFGVFNTLPTSSAFAEDVAKANEYQYVAIKATDDSDTKVYKDPSSEKTYNYHSEFINGERYWVRDGYTIEQIEGQRFPNAANDVQIQAIKSPNASTEGLLQSNRVLLSTPGHSTVLGNTLQKADVGVYMGATNEGGTLTPSSWNYYIQKNDGSYIDAGGANFDKYFVEAIKQADGTYQVNGKTVSSENLYVINDRIYLGTNEKGEALYKYKEDANNLKLGAFVVDGQVYTKNVFGKYNEVLMSAQQGNTYYSYWAANTYDADAPMQLTQGQYKDIVDTMWGNDTYLASSDVSQVKVEQTTEPGKNGGTISLIQQGDYHEGVNGEDGYYENNKTVPGAITITSEGGIDGKDVAVKFANTVNGEESSFTVNAGSKVQGINNDEVVQGSNETTTTIDGLEINGQKYSFDSKTYTDGDGIKFEGTDDGTISVDLATNDEKENISGLHFKNGQLANNLSIEEATPVEGETHSNKGNWSIIEDTGDGTTKTFTNTTLDSTASETANEEAEENSTYVDKDTETSKVTTTYGRDYVVKDTDGNEVELKDIASASTLKDIDINKIGDLQYSEVINEEDPNYDPNTDLTIEDDDSLTVAVGKLDNRVTNNTTNINNLTETVNEGWTAQAGENSIKVTPKDGKNTLNFAGDNNITVSANEATSTIQVGLEDDITLDDNVENGNNVQLSGTNGTISAHNSKFIFDGTGNYDNANDMTFDQNGLTVTNTQTMRENGETTTSSTVINGGSITTGNVTAGGITVNADNGGTVNGLTNKTWNPDNYVSGQAATEDQLKKAVDNIEENDYDGWKVSANGVENGVDVTTGSTVDFSNTDGNIVVGQDGTNLTFDLAKDITLDDGVENGNNVKLSGTNGTINAHNSELIFGGTGKYDNANDMTFDQNGLTVTNTQTMRENGETATSSTVINGGSITTGNVTAGGITVNAGNGGIINGLTNKTWNADNYVSGQAATEDQLKEVVDDIEANDYDGWKVSANGQTGVDVTTGSTVDFSNTDGNIVVGQNGTNLTFDLAKDITLDDGVENGNNVKLSGTNGTINAHNSELIFGGTGKYDNVNDMTFNQNGLTITNTQIMRDTGETTTSSTVINGGSIATGNITAGGITVNADNGGTVNGLTNKTWDADNYVSGQAATEDQLQEAAAASKTTLSNGVNTTVTSNDNTPDGHVDYQVNLNDNVYLGGNNKPGSSNIELDGENGTIQVGSNIILDSKEARAVIGGVDISTTFDDIGKKSSTITGLSNTTWDTDKVVIDRAATEGQLQMVSDKVTAGWTATDDAGNKINVNPETRPTLNFASGKNITVSANEDSGEVEVSLNDNINLNDRIYINGDPEEGNNTIVDIKSGNTSKEESIFAVEDKGNGSISIGGIDITNVDGPYLAVGDGKLKFYKDGGLSTGNATGTFSVRPDGDLEISGKNSSFDVDAETGNINAENNSGSSIKMDGNGTTIAVNDGTVMGNNTTMTVNKDGVSFSAYGNGTTVIDGQTIYAGGVVINNNGSGTINGLTNRDWDGTNYVSGQAATEDQLLKVQQAVDDVASKHTTVSGDENITVNHSDGSQDYQVTLNDNITLGDKADKKSSTSLTLYTDPSPIKDKDGNYVFNKEGKTVTGYVPESYIDDQGRVDDFVSTHGGFMMYATDTSGEGVFGITTDGMVHAKDVISYMPDPNSKDKVLRYSLNDVGDIVTQIAHSQFDVTGMDYTVISAFKSEEDKEDPFQTPEGTGERTIGLAVREDGAVVIGAVVGEDGLQRDELGIRINDDTIAGGGKDTITGLDNTEWTPPTNSKARDVGDTRIASMAATQGQLDDLYSSVVGYNVEDGSIDHTHVTLGGKKTYGLGRAIGDHSGGVILDNVAYAVTDRTSEDYDGSAAVNVDVLNDALDKATSDGGVISNSDKHLVANPETTNGHYSVNNKGEVDLIVADEENQSTITIDNIASKGDIENLDNKIDSTFNNLNNKIENINNVETDVKGGSINEDGTISLKTENEDGTTTDIKLNGQLTDSGVVQEGTSFNKETGTLTITSQDKYSGKTSSVTVDGIASTDVVGVTTKEELADKYKAADEDGNATTAYITESESMVEADVALDHAIQDVANTGYANDMVLSNRIDSVEKRLGNVEERIDKVGAMAAAIANLRTMGFDPEAPTEIAIGVGQYKSETGIAIGVFHYPNQDFMLSASLSSSGDELMGGIGATWKLGRKSAAERAKDEEARHLEQAEEMKKLAQQEKVKAQAQRHAKLLAERQQASQKNA